MTGPVLVTGAGGFVGRQVLPVLIARGYTVVAVFRSQVPSWLGELGPTARPWVLDLSNTAEMRTCVREVCPEAAIHLAWYAVPGAYWTSPQNLDCVRTSLQLVQTLGENGCRRLVVTGSCAEYDWRYGYLSESVTPCRPNTLYGVCKNALREILESFCEQVRMSWAWGRLFFLYGPHESPGRLVSSVGTSLLRGEVAQCTRGNQIRDFLHVGDAASALVALLESEAEGPVNIVSGIFVTVRELVEILAEEIGKLGHLGFGALPTPSDEPGMLVGDTRRLRDEVRWRPSFPLRLGLSRTVAWLRQQAQVTC